jgi:hypothetical protein
MDSIFKTGKHEEGSTCHGSTLENPADLKTNACCTIQACAPRIRELPGLILDEVLEKTAGPAALMKGVNPGPACVLRFPGNE